MFELLLHTAGHLGSAGAAHAIGAKEAGSWHSDHNGMVATHKLNLVGGSNEVYNSGPEPGGAPWSENSYDIRPTDADGLVAEGGAAGPYACDTDGFLCKVYNTQAYDSGVIPDGPSAAQLSRMSPSERARASQSAYMLYTTFGTGAETFHPKIGVAAAAPTGSACDLGEDCNGI